MGLGGALGPMSPWHGTPFGPRVNLRAFRVRVWVLDGVWGLESWSPEVRSLESGVLGSGFWSLESGVLVWGLGVLESGVPNFKKHETMALGLLDQVCYVGPMH